MPDLRDPTLSTNKVDALLELARRNLGGSLYTFMRAAWPSVEPETEFVAGWHLEAICEHLEAVTRGEIRSLVINMPPRHCKSLLCGTFWPAWVWANDPSAKWLCSSYSFGLAVRDSLRMRRLVESKWYKMRFPGVTMRADQNQKGRYENMQGGYRIATTVLGAATGEGGDYIVCDDPHKVLEANSDRARQSVIDWWDQTMSTRGNDPKTVRRVVIGQRVHHDDLCGHLQGRGDYDHLILPAEYEGTHRVTSIGWNDPREEPGDLLSGSRFGVEELGEIKAALGSYASAAQLQQRPTPLEGGVIKSSWLQYHDGDLPKFDRVLQSWDTAFKAGVGSYVCGQLWGQAGSNFYLIDQERGRWGFTETIAAIERLTNRWPECVEILVEDAANGPAIIDTLKGQLFGLVAVRPDGSKMARLSAVSPLFEAGQIYIPKRADWADEYVTELLQFPHGANDDQVDATSMALRRMSRQNAAALFLPRKRIVR